MPRLVTLIAWSLALSSPVAADAVPGTPADSAAARTDSVSVSAAPAAASIAVASSSEETLQRLDDLGFENLGVENVGGEVHVGFENRRYRHSGEALGRMERATGEHLRVFERRLGLIAAQFENVGTPEAPRFKVRYPSDPDFPRAPGATRWPTSRSVDFEVGPLIGYELGRIYQPIQLQFQVEASVHYNPWPGGRATASLVIPVYNDFEASDLHPDVDRLRPGLVKFEQYAWLPKVALASATVGLLGDNRYGWSVGAARPMFEGRLLLDAQADLTGFIAFEEDAVHYAAADNWSSYLGATYRPPWFDIAIHGRVARFLYGDRGEQIEVRRTMGDVDFSLYAFKTEDHHGKGVRITVPIPPMRRATQTPIRVQPVASFPFTYRTETEEIAASLTTVASREDFLRQLSTPSLDANADRYLGPQKNISRPAEPPPADWVSFTGTSGFINTPWAGTFADRAIELGASHIPKKWAYDHRGNYANEPWHMTLGLLPRLEVSLRFTRLPGLKGGAGADVGDPNNLITTDTDHMASFRLALLTPKPLRPGLAIGIDDIEGTRRYHSSYAVTGLPFAILHVQNRLSLGYAFRVFTEDVARHVLDGGFGAFEVSPWRAVATRIEYDTEKWNLGVGVALSHGVRLRAAALNLETLSFGAGWYHKL